MSLAQVKEILFQSNLNFDPITVNAVYQFIQTQIGHLDKKDMRMQVLAAAAIVSEIKQIQTFGKAMLSRFCIGMQNIMGHLQKLSKEEFLSTVQRYIQKSNKNSSKLLNKFNQTQISYRLFKKFRTAFQQLWLHAKLGKLIQNDTLSIFWMLYLFIKNQDNSTYQNIEYQSKLIMCLLKSIFQYYFTNISESFINQVLKTYFMDPGCISQQFFLLYHSKFQCKINQIYQIRYSDQKVQFQKCSRNPIFIARMLDDMSTHFQKVKENFQITNYIDEISYLELKKTMTPKGIRILPQNIQPISRTLKFQTQSSSQEERCSKQPSQSDRIQEQSRNRPLMRSNMQLITPFRQISQISPIGGRLANLEWVNNCIQSYAKSLKPDLMKTILQNYTEQNFELYQSWAKLKISYIIEEYSPKCIDKSKRCKQLYAFFKSFILKVFDSYEQEQKGKIFKSIKNINSILCLATDMFNYAQSTMVPSYKEYCDVYDISIVDAFKPINWIGKNIEKPRQMDKYLYNLQKKIVIKQLWQDDVGYELINSAMLHKENISINYYDFAILVRLHKHISDRVQELCKEVKLQEKLIKRVQNLVKHLIQNKPHLLKNNKIDQIIICGITSFLTINQIEQKQTLDKVFNCYNKLQLSFNANKQGMSGKDGQAMNLIQYYNEVFLPSIQQSLASNASPDFLLTPIRDLHIKKASESQQNVLLAQKYKFKGQIKQQAPTPTQPGFSFNLKNLFSPQQKNGQNSINMYRKRLMQGFLKTKDQTTAGGNINYRSPLDLGLNLTVKNDFKLHEGQSSQNKKQRTPYFSPKNTHIIKTDESNINTKMQLQACNEKQLQSPIFKDSRNFSFGK